MSGRIERIIVPFDATSETRGAIAVAGRLAAHAKAHLHGIFIEDEDLLHLADLPVIGHVTLMAGPAPLAAKEIEHQLHGAAERTRREVAAVARQHGVDWSFEIVRLSADAPLAAATERDLVVASALTRPLCPHFRFEWHWWSSVERICGPFLLAQCDWNASGPVLAVIRDQDAGSARLLVMAARLAQAVAGPLIVICPQSAGEREFVAWIEKQLEPYSVPLKIELAPADPAALDRRIAELHCRVLAISAGAEIGSGRLRELFTRLACDILVVR